MRAMVHAFRGGSAEAIDDLRQLCREHTAREAAALLWLGDRLGLGDIVASRRDDDRDLVARLEDPEPDAKRLWGATWDHADAWEFDVFPHLMMAAYDDVLDEASARGDGAAADARRKEGE